MPNTVLETIGLTKQYKHSRALDNVTIHIEQGHLYGFVGQNGAGKTTLFRVVAGLALPTSGVIKLLGQSGEHNLAKARKRIGSIIEVPAFYPNMTAWQNLEIQQIGAGIPEQSVIEKTLATVGLTDTGKKKVKDFSLGMQQRLAIAMAILNEPEFLILDEPTNGLDPISIVEIRDLLCRLYREQGITMLVSSHILSELHQFATDYIFIHKGKVIQEISHQKLDEKCRRHIIIGVNNSALAATVLERELGTSKFKVLPDQTIALYDRLDDIESVSKALTSNDVVLHHISVEGENLESYFVNLIGGEQDA